MLVEDVSSEVKAAYYIARLREILPVLSQNERCDALSAVAEGWCVHCADKVAEWRSICSKCRY